MQRLLHLFHIPVMGTGHSIDTPIRVAPFGISSVISIVDDVLIEKIRRFYCEKYNLLFVPIAKKEVDARAKRITAYLDTVHQIVHMKIEAIKKLSLLNENDKQKYFRMLPDESPLKSIYHKLLKVKDNIERKKLEEHLTEWILPGSIDVNIMAKVDTVNYDKNGTMLSEEFSDAKAALRGFANSCLSSSIVFSAGFNRSLYGYIAQFKDFYRDKSGDLRKKIILKVSDFRSALIQGKFLAMKGLEVSEYRIESGLNCGGHAFASQGYLLASIVDEFKKKKEELTNQIQPAILEFYKKMGWEYPESAMSHVPLITVQGGIGTSGEAKRLTKDLGCDATGWGSPFLLVPEATCVDEDTRALLMNAKKDDLYLSNASPLGVPFNNLRGTGSEEWTRRRAENGKPGSPCPKGFLVSNTEYSQKPICTASIEYQEQKVAEISKMPISDSEKNKLMNSTFEKVCLCQHLGNGALISLGIEPKGKRPQSICPGPNIVWFDREYSLEEMVDHIYGRGESLVSADRPHMFAQEVELYVNYFEKLIKTTELNTAGIKYLEKFKENLLNGIDYCLDIAKKETFPDENLQSIPELLSVQREKLHKLMSTVFEKVA
ncbi:MAG: hypothetical protein HYV28_17345 [Ignavibacteriales bacterium]|nr:hypothetical protein [Ignavibacteriales bacterium]